MAHIKHKLTPAYVERKSRVPGSYGDGGGLYLYVSGPHACSWVYAYMLNGKSREMGLGPYPQIGLAEARERAEEQRKIKARGQDPLEVRESVKASLKLSAAKAIMFRRCAETYITAHEGSWKTPKQAALWTATLETYAYPLIGDLPVGDVDRALVVKVLEPIWNTKPETAGRVRGRIESVLDWATARDYRTGDNPARWKGALEKLFPARSKVQKVQHHPALAYRELPDFMTRLAAEEGLGAAAMRLVILTACRTGEAIGANWTEIDLEGAVWTVPAERTKMGRAHRVPLSKPAVALLRAQRKATGGKGYVFPGMRSTKPISNMAMLKTLARMGRDDLTVHGFRSTFRDWAEEMTNFPGSVAESALGHIVGDKVEAAYRRGDLFEKRAKLMAAWATFCTTPAKSADVIPINAGG